MTITIIRSVLIYISVVIAVRIMGKRQVGELKPQELVITILISAVATIPIEETSIPLSNSLIPIFIFVSLEIISSTLSMKSIKFRNLMQGKPIFIIKNGKLKQEVLSQLRFTIDDLVDALRQQGAFDISEVENAVVETNGSLSIQLKSENSPLTPNQIKIEVEEASAPTTIVMDSKPITEYFGGDKMSEQEIDLIVKSTHTEMDEIMLLNIDDEGKIFMIKKG